MSNTPNPGSPEAVEAGCTCPVEVNEMIGSEFRVPDWYVTNPTCPLHGFDDGGCPLLVEPKETQKWYEPRS